MKIVELIFGIGFYFSDNTVFYQFAKLSGDSFAGNPCFLSNFFLYSNPSTWSMNVNLQRFVAGKEDNLFNLGFTIEQNNCNLTTRLGNKNEFAVFPLVSFPSSGNK